MPPQYFNIVAMKVTMTFPLQAIGDMVSSAFRTEDESISVESQESQETINKLAGELKLVDASTSVEVNYKLLHFCDFVFYCWGFKK